MNLTILFMLDLKFCCIFIICKSYKIFIFKSHWCSTFVFPIREQCTVYIRQCWDKTDFKCVKRMTSQQHLRKLKHRVLISHGYSLIHNYSSKLVLVPTFGRNFSSFSYIILEAEFRVTFYYFFCSIDA